MERDAGEGTDVVPRVRPDSIAGRLRRGTVVSAVALSLLTAITVALTLDTDRRTQSLQAQALEREHLNALAHALEATGHELARLLLRNERDLIPRILERVEQLENEQRSPRSRSEPDAVATALPAVRDEVVATVSSFQDGDRRAALAGYSALIATLERATPFIERAISQLDAEMQVERERLAWAQRGYLLTVVALALSLTALAIAAARRLGAGILQPIARLTSAADNVARGKLDEKLPIGPMRELASLSDAFNRMSDTLRRSNRSLRRQIERAKHATKQAEAAARVKGEFLSNMSHEIRTPMTAILGYSDELLEEEDLATIPPAKLRIIQSIRRNGQHLLQLLNDVLDLSKIESGAMQLERIRFSPAAVAGEVCAQMRERAAQDGLGLVVECRPPLPATIEGDPTRVRQVLLNLVGNALKFTKEGEIRVVVQLVEARGSTSIVFEVIDPGIGIAPEDIDALFDRFTQADTSTTRTYGGTGLGLAICHRLVTGMQGSIEVQSAPGLGSTFRVRLPTGSLEDVPLLDEGFEQSDTPSPAAAAAATEPLDCRILLAEDGWDNQRLIRRILQRMGAEVELAENGRIAVDRALAARDEGVPFDVILMDVQMPELDGHDATRLLRSEGYDAPIIALTAHAMAEERERALNAGCNAFATKPVDKAALRACIREQLERARG